jgi:hypothetical protein
MDPPSGRGASVASLLYAAKWMTRHSHLTMTLIQIDRGEQHRQTDHITKEPISDFVAMSVEEFQLPDRSGYDNCSPSSPFSTVHGSQLCTCFGLFFVVQQYETASMDKNSQLERGRSRP